MASLAAWVRTFFGDKAEHHRGSEPVSLEGDHNRFALALHRELRLIRHNLFFSPFSIRMALAMAYAGARGETAAQMRQALCFGSSDETVHRHFAEITRRFSAARNGTCYVSIASALWPQEGVTLLPDFVDLIARQYGGNVTAVDFRQPEGARLAINGWLEHETRGKISDLLPPGALSSETRLVLTNAVYFKGAWELTFEATETRDEPFYMEGGGTVQVPLMYQKAEFRYLQEPGFQAVSLDFQGGDVSMVVLLPDTKDGLWDLEARVTATMLQECFRRMVVHEVRLSLPRFKMTCGLEDLGRELQALGMAIPFDRLRADFSGITGHRAPDEDALFISAVVHKAFVEVNEEGAEAAAATAVDMDDACAECPPPPVTFRADHPFLFAIRDTGSGAILFLGRVADPTIES